LTKLLATFFRWESQNLQISRKKINKMQKWLKDIK
jgi:hypothetical protein